MECGEEEIDWLTSRLLRYSTTPLLYHSQWCFELSMTASWLTLTKPFS